MRVESFLVGLVSAAAAVELTVDASTFVRAPAGAVLVLGVGVAWSRVILPPGRTGRMERVAYTLALALTIVVQSSVVLHFARWHLSTRTWALALGLVGIAGALISSALQRRRSTAVVRSGRMAGRTMQWRAKDIAACALAVAVLAIVVVLARTPLAPPEGVSGYTQLWLLPDATGAELGVASFEFDTTAYHLELLSGTEVVREWDLTLAPKERWTYVTPVTAGVPLEVRLHLAGEPDIYRRVRTTITGVDPP